MYSSSSSSKENVGSSSAHVNSSHQESFHSRAPLAQRNEPNHYHHQSCSSNNNTKNEEPLESFLEKEAAQKGKRWHIF